MKSKQSHHLLIAALIAAGLSGCTLELPKIEPAQEQNPNPPGGMQDPSLDALGLIDDALAVDRQFEMRMPPPPTNPPPPPGAPQHAAMAPTGPAPQPPNIYCEATPEVTLEKVCGIDVVRAAHMTWSNCQAQPPAQPEGDQQQPQQQADQLVTSGVIDAETVVTNSICNPVTEVTFTRHSAFSLTKKSPKGELTTSGEVGAEGTQKLAPGTFTRTMAVDVTASATVTDGTRKEFALLGDLTVSTTSEPGKPPVTTIDGTLNRSGDSPETYAFKQVERGDPKTCRWPMKGEIARTIPDGKTHTIAFGPECGRATIDGEQVSLNPEQQQQPPQGGQQPPPQ